MIDSTPLASQAARKKAAAGEVGGVYPLRRPKGATMLADLDLLLTAVSCTATICYPKDRRTPGGG
jgi:hypothetical protein